MHYECVVVSRPKHLPSINRLPMRKSSSRQCRSPSASQSGNDQPAPNNIPGVPCLFPLSGHSSNKHARRFCSRQRAFEVFPARGLQLSRLVQPSSLITAAVRGQPRASSRPGVLRPGHSRSGRPGEGEYVRPDRRSISPGTASCSGDRV